MADTPKKTMFPNLRANQPGSEQMATNVHTPEPSENRPWKEVKQDPAILKKVQAYKQKLADQIDEWGEENGISDLALQHIMTMPKNPDAKVSHYWNPSKSEWVRYRDGDEVPVWLQNLTNRKNYKYPNGSEITSEMLAKFKGRVARKKLTSLDD